MTLSGALLARTEDFRLKAWLVIPFRAVLVLLAALLVPGLTVQAQNQPFRAELFVQGGPSFFSASTQGIVTLEVKNSLGTTGRIFTGARYYFNAKEALEASYSYSPNRLQSKITPLLCPIGRVCPLIAQFPPSFFSESMSVHSVAFNYVRYFREEGSVRPFATGGLGFTVFDPQFISAETKFAGNFGGGVDVRLYPRWRLRVELRDFVSERPNFAIAGASGITHNVVPSVGFVFKF